jgi:hypothetical protein
MGARGRVILFACVALFMSGCSSTKAHRDPTSQVRATWSTFFNTSTSVSAREQLLESGPAFASLLQTQAHGGAMSVVVSSVAFPDATHANVSFSLNIAGANHLDGVAGAAVLDGGTWRVSKSTLCVVLAGVGQHDPACS